MQNNPLYRKIFYQASRRAMLENEDIMRKFMTDIVLNKYSDDKLQRLDILLLKIFDNDLFDILMGQKIVANFDGVYDMEILQDIADYAKELRS